MTGLEFETTELVNSSCCQLGRVQSVRLSDYPRLTARVPAETVGRLRKLAEGLGVPQWRILHDAIHTYKPER